MGADRLTRAAKLQPCEPRAAVSTRRGAHSHPSSTALPAAACTAVLRPGVTAVWSCWGVSPPYCHRAMGLGALLTLQLMSRGCEDCLPRCIGDAHCQGVGMPCHALPCMGVLLLRDPPAPPQGSGGEDGLDAWECLEEAPATACVSEWKFHASALGVVRPATVGGRCWQWRVV